MLQEEKLRNFAREQFAREDIAVNGRITLIKGLGHSNSIAIEGRDSLILVDSLDSDERGARLRSLLMQRTGKAVKTIIFTHSHPDHRGGSAAFAGDHPEIIAHAPVKTPLARYDRLSGILKKRTVRQFGYRLSDEENITQGIGIREGHAVGDGKYAMLPPTEIIDQDVCERTIDGVRLHFVSAPGETDDTVFVWLPDDKVLCCGDNYYGCWPNLYAIRGSQYRDVATWISSLEKIISYGAEALLPGHTKPLFGAEHVRDVLTNYKNAIESVFMQTLDCMEQGMNMTECAGAVKLPENLADLPYLQEFYGTVSWTVKGIYAGYLGWFDGRAEHLDPLPEKEWSRELFELIGSGERIASRIKECIAAGEYQKGLQLCELMQQSGHSCTALSRECLLGRARQMTSANGRHYYLASAKELDGY